MTKNRKKQLIEIKDPSLERNSQWLLAYDRSTSPLKSDLEKIGFRVLEVEMGLDTEDLHEFLQKSRPDAFLTVKRESLKKYVSRLWLGPKYHLLIIENRLLDDPARTVRAIEACLLYDGHLNNRFGIKRHIHITAEYITALPRLKKYWLMLNKK